eukprot:1156966-Pelagomonas_calceolata.AAC.3
MLIWFAQCPVILRADFDIYETAPMVCAVAGITGGLIIIALRFVGVVFAHWVPADLAARVFLTQQPYSAYNFRATGQRQCLVCCGILAPSGPPAPVCGVWVGSRGRACVRGVKRGLTGASVLTRVRLCMWLTVWGRAVLAAGESTVYFHILSFTERVAVSPGVRIVIPGGYWASCLGSV